MNPQTRLKPQISNTVSICQRPLPVTDLQRLLSFLAQVCFQEKLHKDKAALRIGYRHVMNSLVFKKNQIKMSKVSFSPKNFTSVIKTWQSST